MKRGFQSILKIYTNEQISLINYYNVSFYVCICVCVWGRALVQWLRLSAWKVGDRGFEPHCGLQVSKKQNVSSPLIQLKIQFCGEPP